MTFGGEGTIDTGGYHFLSGVLKGLGRNLREGFFFVFLYSCFVEKRWTTVRYEIVERCTIRKLLEYDENAISFDSY